MVYAYEKCTMAKAQDGIQNPRAISKFAYIIAMILILPHLNVRRNGRQDMAVR